MRYAYLDGLPGLAILGVLATHIGQVAHGLPEMVSQNLVWGIRGVHLFFIVSALTLLLVTNPDTLDTKRFALRRFFRIAPMFYLAAIFYTVSAYAGWLVPKGGPPTTLDIVLTFVFLHGFNPEGINNVVPGGWSIACEMTFYALFLLLVTRVRTLKRSLIVLLGSICMVFAGHVINFFAKKAGLGTTLSDFLHFNFLMNSLPFALGVVVFQMLKRYQDSPRILRFSKAFQAILFVALILYGSFVPNKIITELPFAFLLAAFTFFIAIHPPKLITMKPMKLLGEWSFSMYLVHFAVLHFLVLSKIDTGGNYLNLAVLFFLTLSGSMALGAFCHHLIERPFIALARRFTTDHVRGTAL